MIATIIDTNVFISGVFWSGPPAKILDAWQEGKIKIILSPEILDEYIRVSDILSKKYKCPEIKAILNLLTIHADFFSPIPLNTQISRDPDDDKFIATALAADCSTIISGDKDLLEIDGYANLTIIKPAKFIAEFL